MAWMSRRDELVLDNFDVEVVGRRDAAGAHVKAVDVGGKPHGRRPVEAGAGTPWPSPADADDTGLPEGSFDAVVSNMGIIFVEPATQVTEIARLLKPRGVLGFSSWVRDPENPFFGPIVAVLGPPAPSAYTPDQWGEADTVAERLATEFDDVEIELASHTWQLGTVDDAVRFITDESPMHVSVLAHAEEAKRDQLITAFEDTFRLHARSDGIVTYDAPYVVVTALRR